MSTVKCTRASQGEGSSKVSFSSTVVQLGLSLGEGQDEATRKDLQGNPFNGSRSRDVDSLDSRLSSLAHPDRRPALRVPDGLLQLLVKFNKQLFRFEIVMAQDELVA